MLAAIWIFCGFVSSVIAINKGRSGFGWFLLGTLLGPFGFVFALVAGPNRVALEEHALKSGDMRACPYCAEAIPNDAVSCPFCGQAVQLGVAGAKPPTA